MRSLVLMGLGVMVSLASLAQAGFFDELRDKGQQTIKGVEKEVQKEALKGLGGVLNPERGSSQPQAPAPLPSQPRRPVSQETGKMNKSPELPPDSQSAGESHTSTLPRNHAQVGNGWEAYFLGLANLARAKNMDDAEIFKYIDLAALPKDAQGARGAFDAKMQDAGFHGDTKEAKSLFIEVVRGSTTAKPKAMTALAIMYAEKIELSESAIVRQQYEEQKRRALLRDNSPSSIPGETKAQYYRRRIEKEALQAHAGAAKRFLDRATHDLQEPRALVYYGKIKLDPNYVSYNFTIGLDERVAKCFFEVAARLGDSEALQLFGPATTGELERRCANSFDAQYRGWTVPDSDPELGGEVLLPDMTKVKSAR